MTDINQINLYKIQTLLSNGYNVDKIHEDEYKTYVVLKRN